jgi:hypothetical protein
VHHEWTGEKALATPTPGNDRERQRLMQLDATTYRPSERSVLQKGSHVVEPDLSTLRRQPSHALHGEPQPWRPQERVAGVFSF